MDYYNPLFIPIYVEANGQWFGICKKTQYLKWTNSFYCLQTWTKSEITTPPFFCPTISSTYLKAFAITIILWIIWQSSLSLKWYQIFSVVQSAYESVYGYRQGNLRTDTGRVHFTVLACWNSSHCLLTHKYVQLFCTLIRYK